MSATRWRLATFLRERGLSAYALAKAMEAPRPTTIYRLAREDHEPTRVDLPTLTAVLDGLRRLTGEDIQLTDVLEYVPDVGAGEEAQ
ncbi:helix-turn-helix domain-containing protein [Deinococcus radiopugnans]|uniref:ArsR family transcriptional regulator n=1 Tax=Deinococcus radiopugnans ATCC 19172 TaxID=585398 RepID=A0A5C4Y7I2_9DEIO|nr:helix-turn-helix transcriptional regulator [Deinococcus radiopugnans]MBB6016923.1 putative ArsR family transcriptional regulator [Deinococcus radiopugnans ATCC 19172]TNM71476.1 helix-turn-helix transcriptional regulator [Deinococcus radiopugnans ATCC 19172]